MKCRDVETYWTKEELQSFTRNELIALWCNVDDVWKRNGRSKGKHAKQYSDVKRLVNAELKKRRKINGRIYYDYLFHAF